MADDRFEKGGRRMGGWRMGYLVRRLLVFNPEKKKRKIKKGEEREGRGVKFTIYIKAFLLLTPFQ